MSILVIYSCHWGKSFLSYIITSNYQHFSHSISGFTQIQYFSWLDLKHGSCLAGWNCTPFHLSSLLFFLSTMYCAFFCVYIFCCFYAVCLALLCVTLLVYQMYFVCFCFGGPDVFCVFLFGWSRCMLCVFVLVFQMYIVCFCFGVSDVFCVFFVVFQMYVVCFCIGVPDDLCVTLFGVPHVFCVFFHFGVPHVFCVFLSWSSRWFVCFCWVDQKYFLGFFFSILVFMMYFMCQYFGVPDVFCVFLFVWSRCILCFFFFHFGVSDVFWVSLFLCSRCLGVFCLGVLDGFFRVFVWEVQLFFLCVFLFGCSRCILCFFHFDVPDVFVRLCFGIANYKLFVKCYMLYVMYTEMYIFTMYTNKLFCWCFILTLSIYDLQSHKDM